MLVAHWLACIWYVIGRTDGKFWFAFEAFMMIENLIQKNTIQLINLFFNSTCPADNGLLYGWLWKLGNVTNPYRFSILSENMTRADLIDSPAKSTKYITAL